jgi:hypothetical protein
MRFKEFLSEKAMNDRTFSDVTKRLGASAKVGFEFELVVEPDSPIMDEVWVDNRDRGTHDIEHYDSFSDFRDMFYTVQAQPEIAHDLVEWCKKNNIALRAKISAWDHFGEWLKAEFSGPEDFVSRYNLEPKHGWHQEPGHGHSASVYTEPSNDEDHTYNVAVALSASLENEVDHAVVVAKDAQKTASKNKNSWYVEKDESIRARGGVGLEVVSPPLAMDNANDTVDTVFNWMQTNELTTNDTTGLHVGVSIPGIEDKLDPVKLILFMGEQHLLRQFGREGNEYTKPHLDIIVHSIKQRGVLPKSASELESTALKILKDVQGRDHKYRTVNLSKLNDGYVEFRVAGGAGYEQDAALVKKTVGRYVTAIEIACSPDMERKEYLKKLAALFSDKPVDPEAPHDKEDVDALPKGLQRLYRYNRNILTYWHAFEQNADRSTLIALMRAAMETAKKAKFRMDINEKLMFRKLIKQVSMQASDIDDQFGSNHLARLEFKKDFGV